MKNNIINSCGTKRGCYVVIVLPHDSGVGVVLSRVHETKCDIQKVLFMADLSLDKELAQEGQMEKMAA